MQINYYYETDCYTLNKKAHLHYPFRYKIVNFMGKYFSLNKKNTLSPELQDEIAIMLAKKIQNIGNNVDWEQSLRDASYVVFDTETTGLQPLKGDKIISIGAVIVEGGTVRNNRTFEQLVNPFRPIPPTASLITGITGTMVSDKPSVHQALLDFLDFAGSKILVAHNAAFDLAFINIALCQAGPLRILNPVIDTYLLAKSLLPDMIEYSLESLTRRYAIEIEGRHTALGDALMTARVLLHLLRLLEKKEVYTLSQMIHFLSYQRTNNHGI